MQAYNKILVAIDLEHEGEVVLNRALAISDENTQINVIHVITPLTDALYANGLGLVSPMLEVDDLQQEALKSAQDRLDALVAPAQALHVTAEVLIGDAVSTIVAEAEKRAVNVIVLGSHGKKGLQLLLGSTASGVLHHAKCDTLAVRL